MLLCCKIGAQAVYDSLITFFSTCVDRCFIPVVKTVILNSYATHHGTQAPSVSPFLFPLANPAGAL